MESRESRKLVMPGGKNGKPYSKIIKNDGHETACMLYMYFLQTVLRIYQSIGSYQTDISHFLPKKYKYQISW